MNELITSLDNLFFELLKVKTSWWKLGTLLIVAGKIEVYLILDFENLLIK